MHPSPLPVPGSPAPDPALRLEAFLPYRLNRAAATASAQLARIYRGSFGLTIPEWRVLATLGQFGEASATAIGRHSSMHKTKVSRAVAALAARRWLARRRDSADARLEHLTLSPAGIAAYHRLVPQMQAFEHDLLSSLSPADREALVRGLAALEEVLDRATADRSPELRSPESRTPESRSPGQAGRVSGIVGDRSGDLPYRDR